MRMDESTMVYPGGKSRCLSNQKSEYAFQVVRKRNDRLLLSFDGGGACWNKLSLDADACSKQSIWPYSLTGILSRSSKNPFNDYTILHIQYCSGDLFSGNVTQPFTDKMGGLVHQVGYYNTRSAIDWAKANVADPLQSLVITGVSAGAIGTQVWASKLLREFSYTHASVMVDSYTGVFPAGFQGPVFKGLGVCGLDIIRPELQELCFQETITIDKVFEHTMEEFPQVTFAVINSKYDNVQIDFYKKAAISMGNFAGLSISPNHFFELMNGITDRYKKHANFVHFTRPSAHHIYTGCDLFYLLSARPKGGSERMVSDWVGQFHVRAASTPHWSVCQDLPWDVVRCNRTEEAASTRRLELRRH